MKTSLDLTLVTFAVLAAVACSSSINALSQDGAADVPLGADGPTGGAGGGPRGTGGGGPGSGGHPGSGGATISSDAGAGGAVTDAWPDTPMGGGMDVRRDVGTVTGGAGAGGRGGSGGGASGGGNTAKGGSGGSSATGGVAIDAGAATGGVGGGGGGTGTVCAGSANVACPAGQLCDVVPGCGNVYTHPPSGICKPTGAAVVCGAECAPVCGCDGRTYGNDCMRIAAGALKASDGSCGTDGGTGAGGCGYACRTVGGVTGWYLDNDLVCAADCLGCTATCGLTGTKSEGCYTDCPGAGCGTGTSNLIKYANCGVFADAYLSWQAPAGDAGTGPAVVVDAAAGSLRVWTNTAGFSPQSPPPSPTATYTLSSAQTADLFSQLTAVNLAALPHAPFDGWECYARLYVRLCSTCVTTTLDYPVPDSLAPEMNSVWSWFEQLAGTTAFTSPRLYCARATP